MKYKLYRCILVLSSILLVGCNSSKSMVEEDKQKEMFREKFTEQELEDGKAEFPVMENLKVEAEITPVSKYSDGLNSYYLKSVYETDKNQDMDMFWKNPTIFRNTLSEINKIFNEQIEGKISRENEYFDGLDATTEGEIILKEEFVTDDETFDFSMNWETGAEAYDYTKQLYATYLKVTPKVKNNRNMENRVENYISKHIEGYEEKASVVEDKYGKIYKEWMEKILGRKLNQEYECIPVTKEMLDALIEIDSVYEESVEVNAEEFCVFRYCYDIDGFPYDPIHLSYQLDAEQIATPLAKLSSIDGSRLIGLAEDYQSVYVTKEGVIGMEIDSFRKQGEVLEEKIEIVNPNIILESLVEEYNTQVILNELKITDMNLVYAGYFSEDENHNVFPSIHPFWKVIIYDTGEKIKREYFYDATNGDLVEGGMVY